MGGILGQLGRSGIGIWVGPELITWWTEPVRRLILWDAATRATIAQLRAGSESFVRPFGVDVDIDQRKGLVAATDGDRVELFDVSNDTTVTRACSLAGRPRTPQQWLDECDGCNVPAPCE